MIWLYWYVGLGVLTNALVAGLSVVGRRRFKLWMCAFLLAFWWLILLFIIAYAVERTRVYREW